MCGAKGAILIAKLPISDQNRCRTHLRGHKVTGTLLDGDLAAEGVRHLLAVPLQALQIVLVAIEEVHLAACLLDPGMQVEHLQEGAGSTLPHSNDESL